MEGKIQPHLSDFHVLLPSLPRHTARQQLCPAVGGGGSMVNKIDVGNVGSVLAELLVHRARTGEPTL